MTARSFIPAVSVYDLPIVANGLDQYVLVWNGEAKEIRGVNDLNDIFAFTSVVKHNGFSAAARSLKLPKSSVSRRVGRLESRLGVRLLERSTRKLRPTEAGEAFYTRCSAILADLDDAEKDLARLRAGPMGNVRVSCPVGIAQHFLSQLIPDFMMQYPLVRLEVVATNRRIDLIEDGIDVAVRARLQPDVESLMMRRLGLSQWIFVASPEFVWQRAIPADPSEMNDLQYLSAHEKASQRWTLLGPGGIRKTIAFDPVLLSSDFNILIAAASAGRGIAFLPNEIVRHAIQKGQLLHIFPGWSSQDVTTYLVASESVGDLASADVSAC
jgi:DNA-binding transcriptional LysR family regulator